MSIDPESWYFRRTWDDFRRGSVRLGLAFEGGAAVARAYDAGVPQTCAGILSALPLTVPVVHAAWSGDLVMSAASFPVGPREAENAVRLPRPGDLTWDPKYGEICFVYGTAEARLPSGENQLVVFGQIEEGLDAFAAFGRARRFRGLGEIRLERL